MRVAIVVDAYHPYRSSAAIQIGDLAEEFVSYGHEIVLLTPSAELQNSWVEELWNGVRVLRLAAPKIKKVNKVRRALSEFFLPFFMIHNFRKSPFYRLKIDGIVWYSPTIFFGLFIHLLKWKYKCKSYLILRDLFPDVAVDLGILKRGIFYRILKLFEYYQYSLADTIGVQSVANLQYLSSWAKQSNKKLEVLNNWQKIRPNLDSSSIVEKFNLIDKTVLVYAGNFGLMQGIHIVIDLAVRFLNQPSIVILLVGSGSELPDLKEKVKLMGLENIIFQDEIDHSEVPGLLSYCDIGLIFLDAKLKSHNIPGKLISYMQAGLPVLAKINEGNDLFDLINDLEIGMVYAGSDTESFLTIADIMVANKDARLNMSKNCRAKAGEIFGSPVAYNQIYTALLP